MPPLGFIRQGWGCEVLSTQVNVLFLSCFQIRKIFSGYAMVQKWENNFKDRVNDPVSKGKKVRMCTYGISLQNGPEEKVNKYHILTQHMCKIHQTWVLLTDFSKKIERNKGFSDNDLGASMRVFSKGLRLWGLIDTSKYFFSSIF